jgi:hypothetical protein
MSLGSELKVHQYEDWSRDLAVKQSGVAYDLSNVSKVKFTVRQCFEDASPVIEQTYTSFPSPTLGILNLSLDPTETALDPGDYVWDLKIFFTNGKQYVPEELPGDFVVLNAVTQVTN